MSRERISTTVDQAVLHTARRRAGSRDSELFDAALVALLDRLDTEDELRALDALPYEDDPGTGPAIWVGDYDGDVPPAVVELARQRRASRRAAG
jgi:hypothetical protein